MVFELRSLIFKLVIRGFGVSGYSIFFVILLDWFHRCKHWKKAKLSIFDDFIDSLQIFQKNPKALEP